MLRKAQKYNRDNLYFETERIWKAEKIFCPFNCLEFEHLKILNLCYYALLSPPIKGKNVEPGFLMRVRMM